jgi:hypothetical protein
MTGTGPAAATGVFSSMSTLAGGYDELYLVAGRGERLGHRRPGPGRGGPHCRFVRKPFDPDRGDSVRTQFRLVRANSVRTELPEVQSPSLRTPSDRRHLGVGTQSEGLRRRLRPSLGQLSHHRRSIRTGRKLRHDLLDLSLRPVPGPLQEGLPVLQGQVRRQLGDGGQVQPPVGQQGQEEGMLPRGAGGGDPDVGLGLGKVEELGAVREHRGRGFAGVEPAPVWSRSATTRGRASETCQGEREEKAKPILHAGPAGAAGERLLR